VLSKISDPVPNTPPSPRFGGCGFFFFCGRIPNEHHSPVPAYFALPLRGRRRGPKHLSAPSLLVKPAKACFGQGQWYLSVIPKKNTPAAPFQHTDTLLPYPLHARGRRRKGLFSGPFSSCEPPRPQRLGLGRLWSFQTRTLLLGLFFAFFFSVFWVSDNSHQCCKITCCAVSRQPDRGFFFFHPKSNVIKFKVVLVISRQTDTMSLNLTPVSAQPIPRREWRGSSPVNKGRKNRYFQPRRLCNHYKDPIPP